MRAGLLRLAAFLLLLLSAACADLPTTPPAVRAEAGPLAGCYWREDGTAVCSPRSPTWDECDPWEDLDWCDDDGGDCMMAIDGCPGGGGGGGGSQPPPVLPPPPTEPGDTCNTGDPVVESDAIQSVFATIWAQSNYDPNQPHSQRREQGGWITQDSQGQLHFVPFPSEWERTPCGIKFPELVTPPSDIVAWVHTHPYANGDKMTECERAPGGVQVPFTYRGDPSYADDNMTKALRQYYPHVRGYIIDANQITWYTGDDTATTVGHYSRCGY